tara:strand:- start:529 stop:690 length:162 start_codon:yes stop_codon:yes gene_type:complete
MSNKEELQGSLKDLQDSVNRVKELLKESQELDILNRTPFEWSLLTDEQIRELF